MSDLNLLLNARLNDKTLQASADKAFANLKLGNLQKKLGDLGFKEAGRKMETEMSSTGQSLLKITQTFVDGINRELKTITIGKIDDKTGMFQNKGTQIQSITEKYQKLNSALKIVNKSQDDFGRTITTTIDTAKGLKTVITEFTTAQGSNVKKTQEYNLASKELISTLTEVNKDTTDTAKKSEQLASSQEKAKKSTKDLANEQNNLSNSTKKLGQSFSDIITKVAKFYLASLPIRAVQTMVTNATEAVKEFDKAFTELAKVSSLSGNSLREYADTLADIGTEVARTKTEMVQTATELTKAGYNPQDVETLSKLVALYQNTADEELSAADATSVLVSQMKAFGVEAENAIHITDAINKVSQDFAVSSGDIGRGLTQAGAALSTYGNSFDQTIGLITAGTEIFQGKSQQVARG